MNSSLFRGRSLRTKIFTVITVVGIILILLFNLLLGVWGKEGQLFIDMTPEGFYSLSENMKTAAAEILDATDSDGNKKEIEILFCADPDALEGSTALRPTYFMALQLRNRHSNVSVKTVNIKLHPEAVSGYRTTSQRKINPTDMIISYKGTYRIVDISTFWTENAFSYNGEYRMISLLASITAKNSPAAYFTTNHGETYYDPENPDSEMSLSMAYLAELLLEQGLVIKTLDLGDESVTRVPEDCALLIINDPKTDFTTDPDKYGSFSYVSESEKLDRYLTAKAGAVIVNKDYDVSLPIFEGYLKEWGIGFGEGLVKDKDNSVSGVGEAGTAILGVYDSESFGGAYYGAYAAVPSSPKMLFTNSGYIYNTNAPSEEESESGGFNTIRTYAPFIYTSDKSVAYDGPMSSVVVGEEGKRALAAAAVRTYLDSETAETVYSYLFCTNTADFFSSDILGNRSYSNYNIASSLVGSISRTDRYASMSLGGLSMNSPSYGGKQTVSTKLTRTPTKVWSSDASEVIAINEAFGALQQVIFTVIIVIFPVAALILGVVMWLKRRNL